MHVRAAGSAQVSSGAQPRSGETYNRGLEGLSTTSFPRPFASVAMALSGFVIEIKVGQGYGRGRLLVLT